MNNKGWILPIEILWFFVMSIVSCSFVLSVFVGGCVADLMFWLVKRIRG